MRVTEDLETFVLSITVCYQSAVQVKSVAGMYVCKNEIRRMSVLSRC